MYARLVPPFSDFFYAILSPDEIRALHLHPNYVLFLAIFAFYYEAFMGMRPSMVLFCHFFSLQFTPQVQRSTCISFMDVAGADTHLKAVKRVEG
ncbi:retrotransposon protein [Hordeum vulgare]|nr:retrotransposon protein [Hordeum vulgare]